LGGGSNIWLEYGGEEYIGLRVEEVTYG